MGKEILQEVARILLTSLLPNPNVTRTQFQTFKNLKNNDKLTIFKIDKENATRVINITEYNKKTCDIFRNSCHKPVKKYPSIYLEKLPSQTIQITYLDKDTKKTLIPWEKSSRCTVVYCSPKIHKTGAPFRSYVSTFNLSRQRLEKLGQLLTTQG